MTVLELVLSPDAAALVPRLPLVAGLKAGRLRRRGVGIIWHDTSDGALAQQGLALGECRGTWRLERLIPGEAFWPPGAPAPVEAQAASLDLLDRKLPTGLLQVARFDGTLTVLPLLRDGASMRIEVLHGTIGRARTRRPACRMTLISEAGEPKAGLSKAGTSTPGIEIAGLSKSGMPRAGIAKAGTSKAGTSKVGVSKTGAETAEPENAGAGKTGPDNAGPETARADNARPDAAGSHITDADIAEADGETAVFALAEALAADLELAIPIASLAAEARAVATATSPAPRHRGVPQLPDGLTVADAFGFVLGHLADVILFNAPLAASGRDGPEPVHEMRVAVRRLRSAMTLFRAAVGCPAVDAAVLSLKALADRLAPARDWDVFVAETTTTVAKVLPDDVSLRRLRAAAERQRRHAYRELRIWLRGPDFCRLCIALARLAGGRAWMAALEPAQAETLALGLDEFANRALARRLQRLAAAGEAIEHLDPEALHAIRLRAKRMRYVAEVFAPLYPGKATRRFMRRLATLQDRLGRLNDGSVANGLLADLGANAGARAHAAGLVRGFIAARSGDTRGRIARAWERFHRAAPFWK